MLMQTTHLQTLSSELMTCTCIAGSKFSHILLSANAQCHILPTCATGNKLDLSVCIVQPRRRPRRRCWPRIHWQSWWWIGISPAYLVEEGGRGAFLRFHTMCKHAILWQWWTGPLRCATTEDQVHRGVRRIWGTFYEFCRPTSDLHVFATG